MYRDWSKQKHWLLTLFHQLLQKRGGAETSHQSVFNKIITLVDKENAPNYALLLLWASQANATPVSVGVGDHQWVALSCNICTGGILGTLFHLVSSSNASRVVTGASVSSPSCNSVRPHTHNVSHDPTATNGQKVCIRSHTTEMIIHKVTQTHKLEVNCHNC